MLWKKNIPSTTSAEIFEQSPRMLDLLVQLNLMHETY